MPDPPDEDDDDFELELEPVDPEILAIERARAERKTEEVVTKATFEELQQQRPTYDDFDVDFSKLRQFRFTTRHLFIVTAILAIGLTLGQLMGGCMALFVMALAFVSVGWFVVYRKERREALELAREREKFLASRRTRTPDGVWAEDGDDAPPPEPELERGFRFAFSLKQVLIVTTVAAVFLGVLRLVDPKALTITLGALALVFLAIQTIGKLDFPPALVWAWWLLLMLYLAMGLMTAFFPDLMGASRTTGADRAALVGRLC
jgi:hypothetical protein